ncbi:DUF3540 domain-containing protein [Rhizobium calliandrae]|uniref:DUF3540 domain-containing protein n=1 Tax=Rhizobium calliandrae TaxID=1312182 RepID=A0ABT7KJT8_9HYPH|nr:DUF3540 domain-containing protein [Rhizobium calliandrae]MDL2408876.1 DUF3540 domain-containing protein [Rhizobium calliandrae]
MEEWIAKQVSPAFGTEHRDDGVALGATLQRARVRKFLTAAQAGVETEAGESLIARQAASCLLAPVIGDLVLVYTDGTEAFILAVLVRRAEQAAEISVPDTAHITIKAAARVDVTAPLVSVQAGRLELIARGLLQMGESLTTNFRRVVETVVDKMVGARTITTRAESRMAVVKDVEMLDAGSLVQNVESVSSQKSEITLITARRDMRLDGERVSVG